MEWGESLCDDAYFRLARNRFVRIQLQLVFVHPVLDWDKQVLKIVVSRSRCLRICLNLCMLYWQDLTMDLIWRTKLKSSSNMMPRLRADGVGRKSLRWRLFPISKNSVLSEFNFNLFSNIQFWSETSEFWRLCVSNYQNWTCWALSLSQSVQTDLVIYFVKRRWSIKKC